MLCMLKNTERNQGKTALQDSHHDRSIQVSIAWTKITKHLHHTTKPTPFTGCHDDDDDVSSCVAMSLQQVQKSVCELDARMKSDQVPIRNGVMDLPEGQLDGGEEEGGM